MRIGSAWTGVQKEKDKMFIDIKLDKVILEMFPFLKQVKIRLAYIKEEDRASKTSPGWSIETFVPSNDTKESTDAEKALTNEAVKQEADVTSQTKSLECSNSEDVTAYETEAYQ